MSEKKMIDPADVQKVIDSHSWADETTDCQSVLDDVLRDLRGLLPKPDYPEDMLGMWAEHPEYGRVLVCDSKPDGDGEVSIAFRDDGNRTGVAHTWVDPTELSFPERKEITTNIERAAEVMKTHDLFYFKSGDGWMEPHEEVIRCACGEEFYSYIQTGDGSGDDDRDPDALYRQHLTQALADAGLLATDDYAEKEQKP